jgi:predicted transcriptional regulator
MAIRDKLLQEIKKAIDEGRETIHSVAKGAGLDYSVLWKFVEDDRNIKIDTADKLCDFFSLELTNKKKR